MYATPRSSTMTRTMQLIAQNAVCGLRVNAQIPIVCSVRSVLIDLFNSQNGGGGIELQRTWERLQDERNRRRS